MNKAPSHTNGGFSLIEVILSLVVFSLVVSGMMGIYYYSNTSLLLSSSRNRALFFAQESIEAVKSIRDTGFENLIDGTYGLTDATGAWTLQGTNNTLDGLTRSVTISTINAYTKLVTATVTMTHFTGISRTIELITQLTLWKSHTWLETLLADFSGGVHDQTHAVMIDDGAVELETIIMGDWCNPTATLSEFDLPGNGVASSISAIAGELFMGTGSNASGLSFINVGITPGYPPSTNILGTFDGAKTNDIFGEDSYAYLATDTNSEEIIILDLTANPYSQSGYFNAPGSTNAESVFVVGNYGYMTAGNKFRIFDLTSRSGSRSEIGSGLTLAGVGKSVDIVGNYAFVAIDDTTTQMQIIDITNPTNPSIVGQLSLSASGGQDVDASEDGNTVYLVTSAQQNAHEFFIIDTTTKTGNRSVIGSIDTGGMSPHGVTVVTNNRVIVIGDGGAQQYQVFDTTDTVNPTNCGGITVTDMVNDMAGVMDFEGNAFSYIITGDSQNELKIILGGPGGGLGNGYGYPTSGRYTSPVFDTQNPTVAYYLLSWKADIPVNTGVVFQIRSGPTSDLSSEPWQGPDDTGLTYFTVSEGEIVGTGAQDKRYIQYRAVLTSDSAASPTLHSTRLYYQ